MNGLIEKTRERYKLKAEKEIMYILFKLHLNSQLGMSIEPRNVRANKGTSNSFASRLATKNK